MTRECSSNGPGGGSRCHWKLESLHVNKRLETTVEWDENVVEDDGWFYYAGKDTDFDKPSLGDIMREALPGVDLGDQGQGSFLVPASKIIDRIADSENTDGVRP